VLPERIEPAKPQQNGRLERLHPTLLQDTADPPARSQRQQLERFKSFQQLSKPASQHPSVYAIEENRIC
jgi:putative transposase